jgi:hypothetical protein
MNQTSIENSIRQRAFDIFVKRGEAHGNDQDDWFQAEKEIRHQSEEQKSNKRPSAKS